MRVTVLCNEEAIGEVELDAGKPQQSAPLLSLPAFERLRSTLEEDADARHDWAQRVGEAMPEALFANLSQGLAGNGVALHSLSPEDVEAEFPAFAALLRQQTASLGASRASSLRFALVSEHRDARLVSARVRLWMPPYGVRSRGVLPQIIVFLNI